jgi:hypothetical protein
MFEAVDARGTPFADSGLAERSSRTNPRTSLRTTRRTSSKTRRKTKTRVSGGGGRQSAYGTACRRPDGSWNAVDECISGGVSGRG